MSAASGAVRLVPVRRFDTAEFEQRHAHEAWLTRDWPAVGRLLDARPLSTFRNRSTSFALGQLSLHYSDMAAQSYERSADRVRADGIDHVVITITLMGSTTGDALGRDMRVETGGMAVVDLGRPHLHTSSHTRTIMLVLPRAELESRLSSINDLHGATVSRIGTALLRTHLFALRRALPTIETDQGPALADTVYDLITVALESSSRDAPRASRRAHDTVALIRARGVIDANLDDPGLSITAVCRAAGVSRATLYRLFDDQGGVLAYIRERRLDRVRQSLADPAERIRIADLAEHWGFSDPAHLSRLFRERYGISPSDFRADNGDPIPG